MRMGMGPATDLAQPAMDATKSRATPKFLLLSGLVISAATIFALAVLLKDGLGTNRRMTASSRAFSVESGDSEFEIVRTAIRDFLEAATVDELIATVRQPERVAPLIRQYYATQPFAPASYMRLPLPGSVAPHRNFLLTRIELADGTRKSLALERIGDSLKVDWESWVGHSEISWNHFVDQQRTVAHTFRAIISPDDYYNYRF